MEEEISEEDLQAWVYPAIKNHISDNECRNFRWAVCRVDKLEGADSFCFPMKQSKDGVFFLDKYSAPLGNTIYIIGGSGCKPEGVDAIVNLIKKWSEQHDTDYWDMGGKVPKIRIIKVNCWGGITPDILSSRLRIVFSMWREGFQKDSLSELRGLIDEMTLVEYYKAYASSPSLLGVDSDSIMAQLIFLAQVIIKLLDGKKEYDLFRSSIKNFRDEVFEYFTSDSTGKTMSYKRED